MTYDLTCVPTDKTVRKQIFPLTLMFLPICVCARRRSRRRSSLTLNGKRRKTGKQQSRKTGKVTATETVGFVRLAPLPLLLLLLLLRCLFKVLLGSVIMKDIIQPVESGRPQTRQLCAFLPLICTHMYKCVFPSPPSISNSPPSQPTRSFGQFVCDTSVVGPKAELLMQINIGCVSGRCCLWVGRGGRSGSVLLRRMVAAANLS